MRPSRRQQRFDHHVGEDWLDKVAETMPRLTQMIRTKLDAHSVMDREMDSRTPYEVSRDMCAAINGELDRLGWSSATAPEGNTCLDAFPTEEAGLVAVSDAQETTLFEAEGLWRTLCDLQPPLTYEALWHAMLPHMRES